MAGAKHAHALDRPIIEPPRFETAPAGLSIDGRADEAIWDEAVQIGPFVRTSPVTEGMPAHPTTARVFYTRETLFISYDCRVPEGERHIALTQRDSLEGDYIGVSIDTFGDSQRAYQFRVSAAGSQVDQRFVAGQGTDRAWDTTFDSAVHHGEDGYTVELAIPFRDLRLPDEREIVFGVQFSRSLWNSDEEARWTPLDHDLNNALSQYGLMAVRDIESSARLQVLPSLTLSWFDDPDTTTNCDVDADLGTVSACGVEASYGVGLRYALTPALSLDGVFNPDFSQVEADPGQLTLNNRFAIYLAERRSFFLEGAEIFDVGSLYYSRSVSQPVAGLKMTGNVAERTRLGVLVAHDLDPPDSIRDEGFDIPRNVNDDAQVSATTSVVRLQQDILDSSRAGFLLIDREYTGDDTGFSRAAFGDSRFELGEAWVVEAGLGGTWSQDLNGRERTGLLSSLLAVWENENWSARFAHDFVSDDFRNEVGFIDRTNYHTILAKFDHYHRSERPGFRFISPGVNSRVYLDPDGGAITEAETEANTFWDFGQRTALYAEVDHRFEEFEGVDFHYPVGHVDVWSDFLPELSPSLGVTLGRAIVRDSDFWPDDEPFLGRQLSVTGSVSSRPTSALELSARARYRALYGDALFGDVLSSQRILRFVANYLFTNDLSVRLISEHSHPDDEVSFDILFSYVPSPGTVLFVGYRDVESLEDGWSLVSRGAFLKFSYLWAI